MCGIYGFWILKTNGWPMVSIPLQESALSFLSCQTWPEEKGERDEEARTEGL